MELGGQGHDPAALRPGQRLGSHLQEVEWAPGPVWKTLPHHEHIPEPPVSSESLYQLSYSDPFTFCIKIYNTMKTSRL